MKRKQKRTNDDKQKQFEAARKAAIKTLPTVMELTSIAANLPRDGRPPTSVVAGELATQALDLWKACHWELELEIRQRAGDAMRKSDLEKSAQRVLPPKEQDIVWTPRKDISQASTDAELAPSVTFNSFLRNVPGRDDNEREERFLRYLKSRPQADAGGEDSDKAMARFKAQGFRFGEYENHARWFLEWWDKERSDNPRKAADARWEEKRKKGLVSDLVKENSKVHPQNPASAPHKPDPASQNPDSASQNPDSA